MAPRLTIEFRHSNSGKTLKSPWKILGDTLHTSSALSSARKLFGKLRGDPKYHEYTIAKCNCCFMLFSDACTTFSQVADVDIESILATVDVVHSSKHPKQLENWSYAAQLHDRNAVTQALSKKGSREGDRSIELWLEGLESLSLDTTNLTPPEYA